MVSLKGMIFNIEKYHINDGTGIRTAVFLKGCSLHCPWCSNPESQSSQKQLVVYEKLCKKCLVCERVCPSKAIYHIGDRIMLNKDKCDFCGKCVGMCMGAAREIYGQEMTVSEVVELVMKDAPYYRRSGGGITVTGGEPLVQADFTNALLKECKREYISTAVETCGIMEWGKTWKALEHADEILLDIKTTRPEKVSAFLNGACGEKTISLLKTNIKKLKENGKNVIFRCPIIPAYNFEKHHIADVLSWAQEFEINRIDLLPYHEYGKHKYRALGIEYKCKSIKTLKHSELDEFKSMILENGYECEIGG